MAENPIVICRVRALYPFQSTDQSSLCFKQGDYIEVLAQLESGWWDGWCDGQRGWFPSNYVEVIQEDDRLSTSPVNTPNARLSLDLSATIDVSFGQELPPEWEMEAEEGGKGYYYYNKVTGEMRQSHPLASSTDFHIENGSLSSTAESLDRDLQSSVPDSPLTTHSYLDNSIGMSRRSSESASDKVNTESHNVNGDSSPEHGPISHNQKSSPTEDTEWQTSWPKLSSKIAIAIYSLNTAANLGQKTQFNELTMAIVEVVRTTLYCSNTMDKDVAPLKDDVTLRSFHRSLVASLAKLVNSASVASSDTSPDGIPKMQADSNELLASVRNFVETCQEHSIPLQCIQPCIASDKDISYRNFGRRRHTLNSSIVSVLNAQLKATTKTSAALQSIAADMRTKTSERSGKSILAQFRNYTNQVSQFLSVIEDIQASKLYPEHRQLLMVKQTLYDDLGSIFITVQAMTDPSLSSIEANDHISLWLQHVETHMKLACEIMHNMVKEYGDNHDMDPTIPPTLDRQSSSDDNSNRPLSLSLLNESTITSDQSDVPKEAIDHDSGDESVDSFTSALQTVGNGPGGLDMDNRPLQPFTMDDFKHDSDIAHLDDDLLSKASIESIKHVYTPADNSLLPRPASDTLPVGDAKSEQGNIKMQRSVTSPDLDTAQSSTKQDKLKKFFGEDAAIAAEAAAASKSAVNDTPSFLGYDYDPVDIVVNMEGDVKGGTLSALTERLTSHKFLDTNFNGTFLLTYRSFCTTEELLSLLEARYMIRPPEDLTEEQLEVWTEKKQKLVRLRVFNVLKNWLETYFIEEDALSLERLQKFTDSTIRDTLSFSAEQLDKLIKKRQETDDQGGLRKMVPNLCVTAPSPIVPKNMKRLKLLDIDTLELARQLTILDFKLYSSIRPIECLDKAWSQDDARGEVAANVKSSIEFCNQVTAWVTDTILSQNEIRKRCNVIKYWVQVAERCRQLNNFNTCMAVLSAFDNSAIGRLKRTWEVVGARTQHTLAYIRKLMGANKNFTEYREIIHSINPPCIPFLGIYLQDLTFIEDGNSNFLKKSKHLINFSKRMKTAEVIREIQQYQSAPYALEPVKEIQYVIHLNLQNSRDEDTLYALSCALEPREREDEKIARLLQESGFL
ncbi:hypothetical protein Unana1_00061 [Umbelopsis nana]